MDPRKLSTQELVQLCLDAKDEALWCEFVRRFEPLIARVVTKRLFRRIRPNPALVQDLMQETYIKLCANDWKPLRQFEFRHEKALFGFLKTVARNVVEDYFRKKDNDKHGGGREEEDLEKVAFSVAANPGSRPDAETQALMHDIERCLAQRASEPNAARDETIFWLYFRQGMTAKAIAALPGIDLEVKGVESALLRLTHYVRGRMSIPPRKKRVAKG
jgi:RNA polymerase sigma-70 factor, ECF subfamily